MASVDAKTDALKVTLVLSSEEAEHLATILDFISWDEVSGLARFAESVGTKLNILLDDHGIARQEYDPELSASIEIPED